MATRPHAFYLVRPSQVFELRFDLADNIALALDRGDEWAWVGLIQLVEALWDSYSEANPGEADS